MNNASVCIYYFSVSAKGHVNVFKMIYCASYRVRDWSGIVAVESFMTVKIINSNSNKLFLVFLPVVLSTRYATPRLTASVTMWTSSLLTTTLERWLFLPSLFMFIISRVSLSASLLLHRWRFLQFWQLCNKTNRCLSRGGPLFSSITLLFFDNMKLRWRISYIAGWCRYASLLQEKLVTR